MSSALSPFVLTYCTNVHAGESLADIERSLATVSTTVRERVHREAGCPADTPFGIGLWLSRAAVTALAAPGALEKFTDFLGDQVLFVPSLNVFPFGDFHAARVKERVYEPPWWAPARLAYTLDAARVLAHFVRAARERGVALSHGSLSTLAGGLRSATGLDEWARMAEFQCAAAEALAALEAETGVPLVLCLEPEPTTSIETTAEAIAWHQALRATQSAPTRRALTRHLGVCFDACHQAVMGEDLPDALGALGRAEIAVGKIQVSAGIELLPAPAANPAGATALRALAEPRYLHQVVAQTADGRRVLAPDIPDAFGDDGQASLVPDVAWRCHFHVPVFARELAGGALGTTQPALAALLAGLDGAEWPGGSAPHLEIETYTWSVLAEWQTYPGGLAAGIAAEYAWVRGALGVTPGGAHGTSVEAV